MEFACSFWVAGKDLVAVAQRYNSDSHCAAEVVENLCLSVFVRVYAPFMTSSKLVCQFK